MLTMRIVATATDHLSVNSEFTAHTSAAGCGTELEFFKNSAIFRNIERNSLVRKLLAPGTQGISVCKRKWSASDGLKLSFYLQGGVFAALWAFRVSLESLEGQRHIAVCGIPVLRFWL